MKPKNTLILDNEFIQYCELNNITNIDKQAQETFNRGFTLLKYGEVPTGNRIKEIVEVPVEVIKEVIIEKIVEKIIEVPVEVIKEVIKEVPYEVIKEVIKEVPIEVIKEVEIEGKTKTKTKTVIKEIPVEVIREVIREVPVEKIVKMFDNVEINRLNIENEKLKKDLETITNSLGKFSKGKFMKNSDLSNLYDE
jgi:hypothetical protein